MQKGFQLFCIVCVIFVAIGCTTSKSAAKIAFSGDVIMDGQGVGNAVVTLVPSAPGQEPVVMTTSPRGSFMFVAGPNGGGCPAGDYRVTVTSSAAGAIPEKYADVETSGLSVSVRSGMDSVRFELVK
ncbi:MAG: hypothetical protein Q4G68_01915 [Planctomycetia bacterium]|nr:hypothetical protein [Planctomycetia bacterium]